MTAKNSILKLYQVIQKTGLTRDEITKKINTSTFPKPFKLNKQNAWLESQINEWLKSQNKAFPQNLLEKVENLLRRVMLWLQIAKFLYENW